MFPNAQGKNPAMRPSGLTGRDTGLTSRDTGLTSRDTGLTSVAKRLTSRNGGMTLVEIVVAIVIIAISITGTLILMDTTTRRSADPMLERQAISIAESYLEEALQKSYLDPTDGALCGAPEGSRALYDNVCDFNNLDETGARDQNGNSIAGLDGYRVQVSVDTSATLGTLSGAADLLRVDIVVTDPTGRPLRISGYRTSL